MRSLGVLVVLAGVAHADDVNLLVNTPTTIAVSSTVQNAAIVPDHIADGKLSTAWNSRTGELVGAWIAVRVPADAKVKAIKMTAGFAHADKKRGDLFTMNTRIKKVRVSHAGKTIVDHVLDIENRGLQTIPVDVTGGEIELRVLEVALGSKPNWKEACVSELEVWGSVPKVVKSKPAFRIGGLDSAATLTKEQCIKALFPDARGGRIGPDKTDDAIVTTEVVPVNEQYVVCRVDHKAKDETDTTHAFAAVKRGVRPVALGTPKVDTTKTEDRPNEGMGDKGDVTMELVPLTLTEQGLLVHVSQNVYGPMMSDTEKTSTLYRVTSTGLVDVLEWKSTDSGGEADRGDRCELREVAKLAKWMPSTLVLDCVESRGDWHDPDPSKRGITEKKRVERFRWKTGKYEQQ